MDQTCQVITFAGSGQEGYKDGKALEAAFFSPSGICASNNGKIYVIDSNNNCIRMIYNNRVITIAGNGKKGFRDGNALEAMFHYPRGICIANDRIIYVTDVTFNSIRMIHNNEVTTIAGYGQEGFKDGNAIEAMFSQPYGICTSKEGHLYVADSRNNRIRMIIENHQVITIAGTGKIGLKDGNALEAMFCEPHGICISVDCKLYVSDCKNNAIRMIYNEKVTTIAGKGKAGFQDGKAKDALFYHPYGICISKDNVIYVSDSNNNRIRMIYNNQVTTIAGTGQPGFQDGNALEAMLWYPHGICVSEDGNVYVSDSYNDRVRMIYNIEPPTILEKSPFGFAHLLEIKDSLCDFKISFNNVVYHLHSALVNVRCPLMLNQDYFALLVKSNISTESFESFLNFLYSNRLTKEYNRIWPASMSLKGVVELVFIFDLFMNCKWIFKDLKTKFTKQFIELLKNNHQLESNIRNLMIDLLPFTYHLKSLILNSNTINKTNQSESSNLKISYTEYCYNLMVHELKAKKFIVEQNLSELEQSLSTKEDYKNIVDQFMSKETKMEKIDDESMIVFGAELIDLSRLAYHKTNLRQNNNNKGAEIKLSITNTYLDEWTRPDFVIMLQNDEIEYHLHKLILCGRWKYFSQMIQDGFKEVQENRMILPDDWNRSRFEKFMKYVYLNEIDFQELEDIDWLTDHGDLYGIIVSEMVNNQQSQNGDDEPEMESRKRGAFGFEELYDHCIRFLTNILLSTPKEGLR